jgi:hypothetical protein
MFIDSSGRLAGVSFKTCEHGALSPLSVNLTSPVFLHNVILVCDQRPLDWVLHEDPTKLRRPLKANNLHQKKSSGGRPPKFDEPSRPITLTLPESTLEGLSLIDADRGQAIVKLTQGALRQGKFAQPLVDIVQMAANTGLLIVGPSVALKRIPFLYLVEVAPARFLLAMQPGNDFKALEIAVHDILDDVPKNDERERELLTLLLQNIKHLRKHERVSMAEILLVSMESKKKR